MEFDYGRVEGFKGKHHVPDGSGVEVGKSSDKASWCPIEDGNINCVGEPAEQAEEQAVISTQNVRIEGLRSA